MGKRVPYLPVGVTGGLTWAMARAREMAERIPEKIAEEVSDLFGDESGEVTDDVSAPSVTQRGRSRGLCVACRRPLPEGSTSRRRWCGDACRAAGARARRAAAAVAEAKRMLGSI